MGVQYQFSNLDAVSPKHSFIFILGKSKMLSVRLQEAVSLRASLLRSIITFVAIGLIVNKAHPLSAKESGNWLGFRGNGTSASSSAPSAMKMGAGGNVAWKVPMPGKSVAGPIVVGDLVISTSSGGQEGEQLFITAVSLETGEKRWEQSFRATGRPFCHPTSANAAPSPVSDGERIFAFYSSNDLVCLSLEGDLLWYRGLGFDYPKAGNDIGMASSPIIADGAIIAQVEAQGDSFAIGIDVATGTNLWRMARPRQSNWSSPVAIDRPDESVEVVMQSGNNIVAVDPRRGNVKWMIEEGADKIASGTPAGDYLLLPGSEMMALNIGESATAPEVVWRNSRLSPRNASAVLNDERFYSLKGSVLVAGSVKDGEQIWQKRLSGLGGTWATPVAAGGRIFIFDQAGIGLLVEDQGDSADTIMEVDLEEPVLASPAIADGKLIVRTNQSLYCFE